MYELTNNRITALQHSKSRFLYILYNRRLLMEQYKNRWFNCSISMLNMLL